MSERNNPSMEPTANDRETCLECWAVPCTFLPMPLKRSIELAADRAGIPEETFLYRNAEGRRWRRQLPKKAQREYRMWKAATQDGNSMGRGVIEFRKTPCSRHGRNPRIELRSE